MKKSRHTWPTRSSRGPRRAKRNDETGLLLLTLTVVAVGAGWLLARTRRTAGPVPLLPAPIPAPVRSAELPDDARHRVGIFSAWGGAGGSEDTDVPPELLVYEHFSYGMELLEGGNPAQAVVRLEKARAGAPGKTSVHEALGRAYFELNRLREAEGEFRLVVERAPTNDYAHFALARVLERTGRFKEADVHRKLARAMKPDEERYRR